MTTVKEELKEFIRYINEDVDDGLFNLDTETYGQMMEQSLRRHYVEDRERKGLRMSGLGKPAAVQGLNHLGYYEPDPSGKTKLIFHLGDVYENWLELQLRAYGFKVVSSQGQVDFHGVKGHYDFVIEGSNGDSLLVEAKTMSDGYSKQFRKNPDDARGYTTQLALYNHTTGIPAVWVCFNKGTAETFMVEPTYEVLTERLNRAEDIITRMRTLKKVDDLLDTFRAPPPYEEKYRGSMTGNYLVPLNMKYTPFKDALYDLEYTKNGYGKDTEYVRGINTRKQMKKQLDTLTREGRLRKDGANG